VDEEGPDPIDRHVGTRIRGRRVGLRISQTKLGHAIGVTFQQIQKYESGTNRVGASNLFKIARSLGVDVSFFFQGIAQEQTAGPDAGVTMGLADQAPAPFYGNPMNSREAFELMHNYYRIVDPTVRKRLFQLVRTLAFGGGSGEGAAAGEDAETGTAGGSHPAPDEG
jgi:transcriptional regulator with XRE-family HTH domain